MGERKWVVFGLMGLGWAAFFGVHSAPAWPQSLGGGGNPFQSYTKPLPVPDFSLEDLSGKVVQIKDYRGKIVLINFWATWCPSCRQEAPSLGRLHSEYQSKGLVLFRIDSKESRETVQKFMEKNPLKVPILLDEKNKVGKLLGVWVHPTSYLIDVQGMLRYRVLGEADWMGVWAVNAIDQLFREK